MSLSGVQAVGHRTSSRSIHPYFGKVDPALVKASLNLHSREDDLVLDPCCGSGTVIHDSLLSNRNAVGWDSSPLAVMIAAAKILGISANEEQELQALVTDMSNLLDGLFCSRERSFQAAKIPEMPRVHSVDSWFGPNALKELGLIRGYLESKRASMSEEANHLARVAFSKIITPASNQSGESSYSRTVKEDSPGRVIKLFLRAIAHVSKAAAAFNSELRHSGYPLPQEGRLHTSPNGAITITHGGSSAQLHVVDSRSVDIRLLNNKRADLVITSPPYLMSWDYGLYHKFRFYWLGFDLDSYESTEIGRHLRRKNDDVERYEADMSAVFQSLTKVTREGAHAVVVNAPSVVRGQQIDTNLLLKSCAESAGWKLIWRDDTVGIPGPHHGMYASLASRQARAPGAPGKKEHVLIFKR